ncbi:ribosome maturation factor RimM [Agaricicola taiwanensis]|uniref:Ribosome maturation factor RimM n=1 Tax=Agaricicola taiwanensis TaxID=591372 RepID=A0A8J2VL29_9RHOB|nr:ribosome maturation factor RimM [Agaricicola taiwanensis]GGE30085.1 ribosome maturation factor RimM [Agaricicola taiwanensis]
MTSPLVLVAVIGAPHGVRGEVRVKPFTEDAEALKRYGPLGLEDGRTLKVKSLRVQKDMAVVRFDGIDTREAAAALTNARLFVPRECLPEPDDDETFLHADLIGLRVEKEDGSTVGEIVAVPNFGAGDLLEVRPSAGGKTIYLPFTLAFVPTVDLAGGKVVVTEGAFGEADAREQ